MMDKNINEDQELYAYFVQRNEYLVEDNYTFLTNKPEIKQLLNDYMANILLHKPDDVFKFTKDYFSILAEVPNISKVLTIVGPSGVGKGVLIKRLCEEFPEVALACSHTTREQREGEVHGKDYYFCTKEKFLDLIIKNELVEHNVYLDYYYGTSKGEIKRLTNMNKIVLLELDVNGADSIYKSGIDSNFIGILPPAQDILRGRLKKRGQDSAEQINKRLEVGVTEATQIENSSFYNYRIVNDVFDTCYESLRNSVLALYPYLNKK